MVNAHFSQFVKGAPPKPEYAKRCDVAAKISPRKNVTEQIARKRSPVKNELTPEFCIDFHARERHGKPVLSYSMSANAIQFGEILTLWLLENASRLNYKPIPLAVGILKASISSWEHATGEDFSHLSEALDNAQQQHLKNTKLQ